MFLQAIVSQLHLISAGDEAYHRENATAMLQYYHKLGDWDLLVANAELGGPARDGSVPGLRFDLGARRGGPQQPSKRRRRLLFSAR